VVKKKGRDLGGKGLTKKRFWDSSDSCNSQKLKKKTGRSGRGGGTSWVETENFLKLWPKMEKGGGGGGEKRRFKKHQKQVKTVIVKRKTKGNSRKGSG